MATEGDLEALLAQLPTQSDLEELLAPLPTEKDIEALLDSLQSEGIDWAAFNAEAEQAAALLFDALNASADDGKAGQAQKCNTTPRARGQASQ